MPTRRNAIHLTTTLLALSLAGPALAQGKYPEQPVKVIVALAAGGSVDTIARPHPEMPFQRLIEIVNFRKTTRDELEAMATMAGLAENLRADARQAIQRGQ